MKMSASKPAAKKNHGRKVKRIHVEPAANKGYIVNHHLEDPPNKGARLMMTGPNSMDDSPKPAVFNKKKAMMDHISNLADQMHDGEEPEGQGLGESES